MADEFKHLSAGTSLTQGEYEAVGGHVLACQATGDIVYASSGSQLSRLGKGAANTILAMGGSCVPAWTASPSVPDLTIGGGCITLSAATDIDLLDNTTSALSFDASGKAGIIGINTNNCSEGVTMSGTLGVTGVLTANAGVVVDNFTLDGTELDLSSGDFALDVAGDVEINADGGCVNFKDASLALAAIVNTSCVGELRIHEAANYIGVKPPALSADQTWTWPATKGSACQVLTCDGCGVLSWASAGGGAVSALNNATANELVTVGATTTELCAEANLLYDGQNFTHQYAGQQNFNIASYSTSDTTHPLLNLQKSDNGSIGSHTALDAGEHIGALQFQGSNGSAFVTGANIIGFSCQAWSGSNRSSVLSFQIVGRCATALTERVRMDSYGMVHVNDNANASMTTGVSINQGANDNHIFSLKSSDIAHGVTCDAETDVFFRMGKNDGPTGGALLSGFGESDIGMMIRATGVSDTTTKAASGGTGYLTLRADKKSGTSTAAAGSDANLVSIRTAGSFRFIFDAEGSAHADVGTATYDDYCDVEVLRGLLGQTVEGYKESYQDRFGKDLMYNLPFYEENKLIGKNSIHWEERDCGRIQQRAMINFTGLTMLHHSTIIQLADRVDARLTALENQIALQGGK